MKRKILSIAIVIFILLVTAITIIGCDDNNKPVDDITIPVESVTLSTTQIEMVKGEQQTLVARVLPENATEKDVVWGSSNPEVATVDENGKVTAVAEGSAAITATVGEKSATCQVNVKVAVERVELDKSEINLFIGEQQTLVERVLPENATEKDVVWSSSNTEVATVDENGKVTAVAEGNSRREKRKLSSECKGSHRKSGT